MKSHEQFIFDHIISSNSTMVEEIFETLGYDIAKKAMKINHDILLLTPGITLCNNLLRQSKAW